MMRTWRVGLIAALMGATATGADAHVNEPGGGDEKATSIFPALRELTIVRSSVAEAPRMITVEEAEIPARPTRILDNAAAERLFRNSGATLQWIGWEERGPTWVAVSEEGHWLLMAEQRDGNVARLDLEGFVTEIGSDYFIFSGTIKISGTPDEDRVCNMTKKWRFGITQNRRYWRLREFEWCDYLTDYIDIYF